MNSSTPLTEGNQIALTNQKYQKAIKEINKLMSINRSTKKELIMLQEEYDTLKKENDNIKEKYSYLEVEHNQLREQQEANRVAREAQIFEETSQVLKNSREKQMSSAQNRRKQSYSPSLSIPNKELENTGTISEFIDNKRKLEEYEEKLLEKDEKIKEMMKQIMDKTKENTQLYEKQIELMDKNVLTNDQHLKNDKSEQVLVLEQQKLALEKELQKSQESIRQPTNNIAELKKPTSNTFIHLKESLDSNMTNIKSLHIIPEIINEKAKNHSPVLFYPSYYCGEESSRSDEKEKLNPFCEYYLKKVRDLENEIKKASKIISEKDKAHRQHILALKADIKEKKNSIIKMNSLLTKQQQYIEQYIHTSSPPPHESSPIYSPLSKIKLKNRNLIEGPTSPGKSHRNIPSILQGARINTIQSEEYTVSLNEIHKANYGLTGNGEDNIQFVEGTKYYNN